MAGHSKFKNIMHRKGAQDKKRSSLFSKLSREITVAAKMGLPDPDANARLRAAVNAAKAQSMPKDNIQRAIDKAAGNDGDNYEEIRYEGYGPGGVSLIVLLLVNQNGVVKEQIAQIALLRSKLGGVLPFLAPKEKPKRDWFVLTTATQLLAGVAALWFTTWLLGRVLVSIPSEFHEGTTWERFGELMSRGGR